jgi:cell division protein FtsL
MAKKKRVKITIGEKLLYGTATLCLALLLVLKIFCGAGISHLNMSIEKKNYDISVQEKKNESLSMKVNELTSFDKVREVATNMGLEYNNDNIIVVNR